MEVSADSVEVSEGSVDLIEADEQALWRAYLADRDGQAGRDALLLFYDREIQHIARRRGRLLHNRPVDADDLAQEAYLHLVELIGQYDPARGVPARAFVRGRLSRRAIDFLRIHGPVRRGGALRQLLSLDDPLPDGHGSEKARSLGDLVAAGRAEPAAPLAWRDLRRWVLRHLPYDQAHLAAYRFFRGWSLDQYAAAIGRPPGSLCHLQARTRRSVRWLLKHMEGA
jgi:RNA polymerase sigma factor (sigma-70 family)